MSNLSVALISQAVNNSYAAQDAANKARWTKFCDALKDNNKGLIPTVVSNGRLHSPVNGYVGVDGHIYLQGQFIPHDDTDYEGSERLKVRVKSAEFIAALRGSEESMLSDGVGTTWYDANGIVCANLYLEVGKGEADAVIEAVKAVQSGYSVEKVENTLAGKQAVLGVIVELWQKTSEYGVQEGFTMQMADGAVYKGTLPKAVHEAKEGDIITFVATFTKGSPYFKRPSKAAIYKGEDKKVA